MFGKEDRHVIQFKRCPTKGSRDDAFRQRERGKAISAHHRKGAKNQGRKASGNKLGEPGAML